MSKPLEILVKNCKESCLRGSENRELCFLERNNYALCEHTGPIYENKGYVYLRCNLYLEGK